MRRRSRPFIFVLGGVNGAGKSSVGGHLLTEHGLTWFNPDSYARALLATHHVPLEDANAAAWNFGREQLAEAVAERKNFAFETTLGASTRRAPRTMSRCGTAALRRWTCIFGA